MSQWRRIARKFMVQQLFQCSLYSSTQDGDYWKFGDMEFVRIWIMGVVVDQMSDGRCYIDDTTGIIRADGFQKELLDLRNGQQVHLIGRFKYDGEEDVMAMDVEIVIDSNDPNALPLWLMEVMEVHRKVYLTDAQIRLMMMNMIASSGEPSETCPETLWDY
ncbi:hypothetical protein HDU96_008908 [Phlyctochytrium bullatum]|nr:hypothetical protein HDU96_008908 [Phlyctochytrium bullatum]